MQNSINLLLDLAGGGGVFVVRGFVNVCDLVGGGFFLWLGLIFNERRHDKKGLFCDCCHHLAASGMNVGRKNKDEAGGACQRRIVAPCCLLLKEDPLFVLWVNGGIAEPYSAAVEAALQTSCWL